MLTMIHFTHHEHRETSMSGLSSVGYFLVITFFSALSFILWARLFIRYFAIGPFHPVSQTIYKLTTPILAPIQTHIMRSHGARGRFDLTCLAVLFIVELLKFTLISGLFLKNTLSGSYIVLASILDMIIQPCNILFYAIIIRTLLSWLHTDWRNPMVNLIVIITEPLLRKIRNTIPYFGIIDFSPLVALLLLKIMLILVESVLP